MVDLVVSDLAIILGYCYVYADKRINVVLKPVIQEEITGCGIASVANVLGRTYSEMKSIANDMGIYASDESLWSDTQYVRRSDNVRSDFDAMQPKWFTEVKKA